MNMLTPVEQAETVHEFLRASGLRLKIGPRFIANNPDGNPAGCHQITFTRKTGATLQTVAYQMDVTPAYLKTPDGIFDFIKLVLGVDESYKAFSKWRLREGVPIKEVAAEWNAYQAIKRPLIAFLTPDERTSICLGFY